jgi:phosphatidylinositol-bisphosphatase
LLPNDQSGAADIYAIGFQEIVDLNAMNVALDSSKSQSRSLFWQEKIENCLRSTGSKYVLVAEKHLVGLMLCVFSKDLVRHHIKDVRSTSAGVGIMGMMGNKGGVSIRMSVYDSSVCFVCAHLAAHRDNIAGRNSDFKNIVERSLFVAEDSTGQGNEEEIGTSGQDQVLL